MFSEFLGFKTPHLFSLPDRIRYTFELKNALITFSLILYVYSAYLLLKLVIPHTLTIAISVLCIALTLFCIQILIVSASGIGCNDISSWQPSKIRIIIFLVISLIFSQPLLLSLYSHLYADEVRESIELQKNLRAEFLENSIREKESTLIAQIASQNEVLKHFIFLNDKLNISNEILFPGGFTQRKALLIGNQAYQNSPLNNPNKDANELAEKLNETGYKTTLITDGTKATMEIEIDKYIKSIQPGDISFFYFSGHGFQDNGNNYIVPIDFVEYTRSKAIGLNIIIESISRKHPIGNIIVIDACRSFPFGSNGGLAATEAGINTYIALAAKPGQFAKDGMPGTNGIFTAAILKHINSLTDVDNVFRDVRKDVAKATENQQETWTSHNLSDKLILPSLEYANKSTYLSDIREQLKDTQDTSLSLCDKLSNNMSSNAVKQNQIDCNQKILLKLEDQLTEHQNNTKKVIEKFKTEALYSPPIDMVTSIFYSLRKNPAFLTVGTVTITILLMLGFYMRESISNEIIEYENLLNYEHKYFISEKYKEVKEIASLFEHTPDEDLRNSNSSPYKYIENSSLTTENQKRSADDFEKFFSHLNDKSIGDRI